MITDHLLDQIKIGKLYSAKLTIPLPCRQKDLPSFHPRAEQK